MIMLWYNHLQLGRQKQSAWCFQLPLSLSLSFSLSISLYLSLSLALSLSMSFQHGENDSLISGQTT